MSVIYQSSILISLAEIYSAKSFDGTHGNFKTKFAAARTVMPTKPLPTNKINKKAGSLISGSLAFLLYDAAVNH